MKKLFIAFIFLLGCQYINSQAKDTLIDGSKHQIYELPNGEIYTYDRPRFFDFITKLPKDFTGTIKGIGEKENLIALGAAAVTTVALLPADQCLTDRSREIGGKLGMAPVARYKTFGPLSNIPPDIPSAIYLIGNGTTPILLSMGFTAYGLINNDYRSLHTASGLIESIAISGIFSQTIKRISGRQSPSDTEGGVPGGEWNPFPSFKAYANNTPNYDAFPSGHVMTATSALYVILGNYPEVKWIKPVGFGLIGILGFQMAQSHVHWVSDYPVALVMGYIIGKNIAKRKMKKSELLTENKKYSYDFNASRNNGFNMLKLTITF